MRQDMSLLSNFFQNIVQSGTNSLQNITRILGNGQKASGDYSPMYGGGEWWSSTSGITQEKLMKEARGWVYACITKIAEEVSTIDIHLYRVKGKDRTTWEELDSHELLDTLNSPNDTMPRFELFQLWSMHDDLTGNAYWLLDGVDKEGQQPKGIIPLNPRYLKPIVTAKKIVRYDYCEDQAKTEQYQPFQVIHFRRPNPSDLRMGLGPTEAAADSIDADNWAREWNRRFFQNGGSPGLILETTQTNERLVKLLRQSFDDRHAGVSKSHRTAVLPPGVKVANPGFAQKDMDFSELRRQMRDEILAHFGVPGVVLGLGLGETINRASAETLEYVFSKRTIRPKMRRFIGYLNEFLVPLFGDDLILDFDDPVQENVELTLRSNQVGLGNAPYLSINEVRAREGLSPIDGGDVVYGSSLQAPVGTVPKKAAPKRQSATKQLQPSKPRFKKNAERRAEFGKELTERIAKMLEDKKQSLKDSDWSAEWEAFVKRVEPQEKELTKIMAKYAERMGKRLQDALREEMGKGIKAFKPADLVDEETEVADIISLLTPQFEKILEEEGTSAAELIGAAFDATDERVQSALSKATKLLAQKYTKTTIDLVENQLSQGIDAGEGLDELSARLQTVVEFSSKGRAERLAKTESFRVANFATRSAWQQSGVVKSVKWYTAADEMVCPYCSPMNGTVVGIEENFLDKGDDLEGTDEDGNTVSMTADYADIENPPLHPNCRCYIRPEEISI